MLPTLIAAAISAAMDYYKQRSTQAWQSGVSDQLQLILTKLEEMDAFLHSIPGIFKTALEAQQRTEWRTEIRSAVKDAQDLIARDPQGPGSADARAAWIECFVRLKTLLENNTDYQTWGFEQFAIVAAGLSAAAGLCAVKLDKDLFGALIAHMLDYYRAAVDPLVDGSFAKARADLAAGQAIAAAEANALFGVWWNTGYATTFSGPHGPGGSRVMTYSYAGSVQGGVGPVSESSVDGHVTVPFLPGTSGTDSEAQAVGILSAAVAAYRASGQQISDAQACIDSCEAIIGYLKDAQAVARKRGG